MNNDVITIEHIIAKIDNDFNPDNSDWIPRVGPWCVDAMSQLKLFNKVTKTRKLEVHNKLVKHPCGFIKDGLKIYDSNGCEVVRANKSKGCCDTLPTGDDDKETDYIIDGDGTTDVHVMWAPDDEIMFSTHVNTDNVNARHNVHAIKRNAINKNYVIVSDNTIELNFDDTFITVVNKEVETKYSDYYKCELPVIPNNGLLVEALAYYCMYKMLTRGYKHPVFNLNASQYGTNPYYMWTQLKDKAKTSVVNDRQGDCDTSEFRSYFFNSTFPKK